MIKDILINASDNELGTKIYDSYVCVESNYFLEKHRYSGLEAGHFVEAVRRLIEHKLFGNYTPLSRSLTRFDNNELERYLNASGSESYRILIPRALHSIYTLRNRRGIGHISSQEVTNIDTSYILSTCKWILAEIVRLESNLPPKEIYELLSKIQRREIPIVWKHEDFTVITDKSLTYAEKILLILMDQSPTLPGELREAILCKNVTRFSIYLNSLKKKGLIHIHTGNVYISPEGVVAAEKIILGKKLH